MLFTVISKNQPLNASTTDRAYLRWDDWNDFSFTTAFDLIYVNRNGKIFNIGGVKIGHRGQMNDYKRKLTIGDTFDVIGDDHFSIGLDDEYYRKLNLLGADVRDRILYGLKDLAKMPDLLPTVQDEEVFYTSLLRGVSITSIEGQFRRLAFGEADLTPFNFKFFPAIRPHAPAVEMEFSVDPFKNPPSNVHVLIGKNGVGKTSLIQDMIGCLTKSSDTTARFEYLVEEGETELFANLICITFSAFDFFEHPVEEKDKSKGINYSYIGLKSVGSKSSDHTGDISETLAAQMVASISACRVSSKEELWINTISGLGTDDAFRRPAVLGLIEERTSAQQIKQIFTSLSSGHKIILLTISRLVEKLEEKSLVLIDEPECHLHPPLLASFMRTLSKLLTLKNAVSIIATHSPVVIQEVPRKCSWKLRRSGDHLVVERPQIETFGENVSILTQEIFGLEVTQSGYHTILEKLAEKHISYEEVIAEMEGRLGLEARGILRVMFHDKGALQ